MRLNPILETQRFSNKHQWSCRMAFKPKIETGWFFTIYESIKSSLCTIFRLNFRQYLCFLKLRCCCFALVSLRQKRLAGNMQVSSSELWTDSERRVNHKLWYAWLHSLETWAVLEFILPSLLRCVWKKSLLFPPPPISLHFLKWPGQLHLKYFADICLEQTFIKQLIMLYVCRSPHFSITLKVGIWSSDFIE